MEKWFQIISLGVNGAILIAGFKIIRQVSRLEFQVEVMWKAFEKRYGASPIHVVERSHRK